MDLITAAPPTQALEHYVDACIAADFIGMKPRALLQLARASAIPAYPLGDGPRKTWRFLLSDLSVWMRARGRKIQ